MPESRRRARPFLHLRVELLEPRQLRAADFPAVVNVIATDPAAGAVLSVPPAEVSVTFDQPIDPTSLGNGDIQLDQVADDGTLNWLFDATEQPGALATQVALIPAAPLDPGHYRIILAGGAGLLSTDGSPLAGDGVTDQPLADFTVNAPGVTLADAHDVGTAGTTPTAVAGALDLADQPEAVDLYKFTLPAGHFWRFGAEVTAQRDGSTLDAALTLFDAAGNPIATDDQGRIDDPADPYLFAGLGAGTYYLGVSGTGNLPGLSGGYDLADGLAGTVVQTQPGGPYTLDLQAVPEDSPPTLELLRVDHADPEAPSPTGLTLQLSDAIRLGGQPGTLAQQLDGSIRVVDEQGRPFSVVASSYDESASALTFLFEDRPAPGTYTVELPDHGGLVDLAGLSPQAPGQPPGVLGTFTVSAPDPSRPADPENLGPLLPGAFAGGVSLNTRLLPGQTISYRLAITFPALYTLGDWYSGGSVEIARVDPDGTRSPLETGKPDTVNSANTMRLAPGVYRFEVSDVGTTPVAFDATLTVPVSILESILENGLGQGPALSLSLIAPAPLASPASVAAFSAPTASAPAPTAPAPTPFGPPAETSPSSSAAGPPGAAGGASPAEASGRAGAGPQDFAAGSPSGPLLTFGGTPLGFPSTLGEQFYAVGPAAPGASSALALGSAGLLQGIAYGTAARGRSNTQVQARGPGEMAADVEVLDVGGLSDAAPAPGRPLDVAALGSTRWLDFVRLPIPRWLAVPSTDRPPAAAPAAALVGLTGSGEAPEPDPTPFASAGLSPPLEIGLVAGVVVGYRQWHRLRRRAREEAPVPTASKCYIPPSMRPRRTWRRRKAART